MDMTKIRQYIHELSNTYSLPTGEVQYALETCIAKAYGAGAPSIIREDGKVYVLRNDIYKCVVPGVKTLRKAFSYLSEELLKASFRKNKILDIDNEKLVYGKVLEEVKPGMFKVALFNSLINGKELSIKLINGSFNAKKFGIKGETYQINRHYLFHKIRVEEATIHLERNNNAVYAYHFNDIVTKISKALKRRASIRIVHIESKQRKIFVRYSAKAAHLIPLIKKKMEEKCKCEVIATVENVK